MEKEKKKTKRARDEGRKYQSGANKAKKRKNTEKLISELPKLSSWFKKSSENVSDAQQASYSNSVDSDIISEQWNYNDVHNILHYIVSSVELSEKSLVVTDEETEATENVGFDWSKNNLVESSFETYSNDIGWWPDHIGEGMKSYWLGKGSAECRNYDEDFEICSVKYTDCVRHCTKSIFIRELWSGYVTQKPQAKYTVLFVSFSQRLNVYLQKGLMIGDIQCHILNPIHDLLSTFNLWLIVPYEKLKIQLTRQLWLSLKGNVLIGKTFNTELLMF